MTPTRIIELEAAEEATPRTKTAVHMYGPYFVILGWEEDRDIAQDCIRAYSTRTSFACLLPIDELMVVAEHEAC